jgi:hypothetical protein
MKKLILIIAILSAFASCSDDDGATANSGRLLKTITSEGDSQSVRLFHYDNNNRLVKTTAPNSNLHTDYFYNGDNIIRIEGYDGNNVLRVKYIFEYENDRVIKSFLYNYAMEPTIVNKKVITYGEDGTIMCVDYSGNEQLQETFISTTQVKFVNGNIAETDTYYNNPVLYRSSYTFDVKDNPLYNIKGFDKIWMIGLSGGANNILTATKYNNTQVVDIQNYTYTYNTQNLPLTSTTSVNGSPVIVSYVYE